MNKEEAIKRIRDFGLYHAIEDLPYSAKTVEAFEMAIQALEEPERKKGKWIEIKRNDVNPLTGRHGVYVGCSECGCPIPTDTQLDFVDESEVLFCFACGANMKEETEDAEIH